MNNALNIHNWNVSIAEAKAIQEELRQKVVLKDQFGNVRFVAGVDVGFEEQNTIARTAIVVLTFPDLKVHEHVVSRRPVTFPYVPGYLSFREIPGVLDALSKLKTTPDLLLCDGAGIAHPRRLGIAAHIGVLTGFATIGVAKSRLLGKHETLPEEKGAAVELIDKNEVIGWVLRSRTGVKPLYISPGHKVSLETAKGFVLKCLTKYRLPETTRWAHKLASDKRYRNEGLL